MAQVLLQHGAKMYTYTTKYFSHSSDPQINVYDTSRREDFPPIPFDNLYFRYINALTLAIILVRIEFISLLMKHGVDINKTRDNGWVCEISLKNLIIGTNSHCSEINQKWNHYSCIVLSNVSSQYRFKHCW